MFKFGAQILRRQVNLFRPKAGKGFFVLFGDGQNGSPTGYEVSDLLAGWVQSYQIGPPFGMVGTRNWETGYFAQGTPPSPLPGACARAVCGAQAAVDSRGPACPQGPPMTDKPADACRLV